MAGEFGTSEEGMDEAFMRELRLVGSGKGGCSVEGYFSKGAEMAGDETHARDIGAD